jgi:quercetin dioxygenase-like cupin family protein
MRHQNLSKASCIAGLLLCPLLAGAADPAPPTEVVEPLISKALAGAPEKELLMLTVQYLPGRASLPHRHDAQVFVYVLEGEVLMQVEGSPTVTLHTGQTFYEGPADVHVVSANASKTKSAKILVFMVKDKSAPATRGVASGAAK